MSEPDIIKENTLRPRISSRQWTVELCHEGRLLSSHWATGAADGHLPFDEHQAGGKGEARLVRVITEPEPFTVHGNDSPIMYKANDLDTDRLQAPSRSTETESLPGPRVPSQTKPSFKLALVMNVKGPKSQTNLSKPQKRQKCSIKRHKEQNDKEKKVSSERREKEKQGLVSCWPVHVAQR